jgi:predicted nucleic-acid-binding protein
MIILDTSYYIRFLVRDNEKMYEDSTKYFEDLESSLIEVYLPDLILAEIVYVLTKVYELPRFDVATALQSIIAIDALSMDNKSLALTTLELFSRENLDFADCFLLGYSQLSDYDVITFDKKLSNKITGIYK